MRFLIDADLPRAVGPALQRAGHTAFDARDLGLGDAPDSAIAAYAQTQRLCLLTGDFDFADIRNYPPPLYLEVPAQGSTASGMCRVGDFPGAGHSVTVEWDEPQQSFVVTEIN